MRQQDTRSIQELLSRLSAYRQSIWQYTCLILVWLLVGPVFFANMRLGTPGMSPEIKENDSVIIYRNEYMNRRPRRGQIVSYQNPSLENKTFDERIGRVIGLGGEKIEIRKGDVYINDQRLQEDYVQDKTRYESLPLLIPIGYVYILADSRNLTGGDSHNFGPVPERAVTGRAILCYYPLNQIRWFRQPTYSLP